MSTKLHAPSWHNHECQQRATGLCGSSVRLPPHTSTGVAYVSLRQSALRAELFTDGGNSAVVRLPVRRSPGLGRRETPFTCRSDLAEVVEACERCDLAEARQAAGLLTSLDALLARHVDALEEHEISRPY